jgi:glycosyltransferase involved in cell wall biosynthesis
MKQGMVKTGDNHSLRIVFLTHYSTLYGANRSLLNLIDGLENYPIIPYVIAPTPGPIVDELEKRELKYAIVPMAWWVAQKANSKKPLSDASQGFLKTQKYKIRRLRANLRAVKLLRNQFAAWQPDIIYTNSAVLPVGFMMAITNDLPHIWHLREFVDLDYAFNFDWGKFITKKIINTSTAKIAISSSIQAHYSKSPKDKKYHVIYNGVARQTEFDRLRHQVEDLTTSKLSNPYTFSLVGKLSPAKGQETAIKALALLPREYQHTRLLIVGGEDDKPLRQLASQLGVSHRVEFWGQVADPFQAYLASDAVLMCSRNEGMGRVTVEAMATCKPVIGFDNAGTSEIIKHEQTGLLYKGNEVELAAAMKRLIANPHWGKELGMEGWKNAREEYCIEKYSQRVFEVLLSVLPDAKQKDILSQPGHSETPIP